MKHRLHLSLPVSLLVVCLAGVFWHYSRQPLHHTDLWGHLAYGRWIVEHGRLPPGDPFMPLAQETPVVDTAWLSQIVGFGVDTFAGVAGLQTLHALAVVLACALLAWTIDRRTGSAAAAAWAVVAFVALERFQFRIIRPQMAGLVGFVALMAVQSSRPARRHADGKGMLLFSLGFVLWANLHGSFVTGLGLLALAAGGRGIDVARRQGLQRALHDRRFRWLIRLTLCAALMALMNPYGPRLYLEVLTFARNPNLGDLLEWMPMNFGTGQGRTFGAVACLLLVTTVAASRRFSLEEWLPLIVFGVATVWSARMIVWWAPLAAAALATETSAIFRGWILVRRSKRGSRQTGLGLTTDEPSRSVQDFANQRAVTESHVWTGVALTAAVIAVCAGPLARGWRGGGENRLLEAVSPDTPVEVVGWLSTRGARGLVFNTCEWGDYLTWAGPPDLHPFVTSQVHLIPSVVWRDHRAISRGAPDSLARLDEYQVDGLLLDRNGHHRLQALLAADRRWSVAAESPRAIYYIRAASTD